MTNDQNEIVKAYWELGYYFSRLGGSARYFNMPESDIPIYVACLLVEKHDPTFSSEEFVNKQFIEAASPVLEKVNSHIDKVAAKSEDLAKLIHEFIDYADSKLNPQHRSPEWIRFMQMNRADKGKLQ